MKTFAIIIAASLAAADPATLPASDSAPRAQDIVVTAVPMAKSRANLDACIARGCPPQEDMKATLVHAENQFVAGAYRDARQTLEKSLDRNRRHKAAFPLDVADLLSAQANVAEHLGEAAVYRHAMVEMRDTLKANLAVDDPHILRAELDLGDARVKMGYPEEATRKYLEMERHALQVGQPEIAALARLRHLSMLALEAQTNPGDRQRLRKAHDAIAAYVASPTPGAEKYALVGELLQLRLDRAMGVQSSTDALIARMIAEGDRDRPALLFTPAIEQNEADIMRAKRDGQAHHRGLMTAVDKWVDIGFWVNDEGRVEEAEILRSRGRAEWAEIVLRSIRGRLYVPAAPGGVRQRFFMVERYTLTAHWTENMGSKMRQRSSIPRIERLDLTP